MPQVQPLGGGPILQPNQKPKPLDPMNDMGMNDGNAAGPMIQPMPKPQAPGLDAPGPKPQPMQGQAKPSA